MTTKRGSFRVRSSSTIPSD